ncbi:GntR family transcriptional regulator [Thermoleophilia bacterium SCSIO 60948]|nr:GntR family transcriptional regulator [Thermoleophilia bacterium SCSIO 60948]
MTAVSAVAEPIASATPLRRENAHLRVYAGLLDEIVRAEHEPGKRLSENELAASFGVSRTPVREALATLRDDGLVEVLPKHGTFVAPISEGAVRNAQFIREALECAAIRTAAIRVADSDIAELEAKLAGQERAERRADHDAFYALDDDFHHTLCDLSGYAEVWRVSQRAKSHLNRVRRLSLPAPDYLGEMIAEHRVILTALGARDPDAAESAMRHHLGMVLRELPRLRDQFPGYFTGEVRRSR